MAKEEPAAPATKPQPKASAMPADADARRIVRLGLKAALGTLRKGSGDPYVSLVTVATDPVGAPLILISRLAVHTQNLLANPRASLMLDATGPTGDPLAGGRVTLSGRFAITTEANDRRRFLARQPNAQMYADFPDFAFYKLDVESAHYIGGFGRIVDLTPQQILLDATAADSLVSSEADVVSHMNDDHGVTNALYAQTVSGAPVGTWTFTGLDPEGFDLVNFPAGHAVRLPFSTTVSSANGARLEFVRLANDARGLLGKATNI